MHINPGPVDDHQCGLCSWIYLIVVAEIVLSELDQLFDGDVSAIIDVAHLKNAPQQNTDVALHGAVHRHRR